MNRMLFATVALALALALPAVASAQCGAGNGNSTKPACIALVGLGLSGAADPVGAFTVTVRDNANNGCPGSDVRIDFTDCVDLRIAPPSDQPYPGMIVDCENATSGPIVPVFPVRVTQMNHGTSSTKSVSRWNPPQMRLPQALTVIV